MLESSKLNAVGEQWWAVHDHHYDDYDYYYYDYYYYYYYYYYCYWCCYDQRSSYRYYSSDLPIAKMQCCSIACRRSCIG